MVSVCGPWLVMTLNESLAGIIRIQTIPKVCRPSETDGPARPTDRVGKAFLNGIKETYKLKSAGAVGEEIQSYLIVLGICGLLHLICLMTQRQQ